MSPLLELILCDSPWGPYSSGKKQGFQEAPVSRKKDSGVRRTWATSPVLQGMGHVNLKQVTTLGAFSSPTSPPEGHYEDKAVRIIFQTLPNTQGRYCLQE